MSKKAFLIISFFSFLSFNFLSANDDENVIKNIDMELVDQMIDEWVKNDNNDEQLDLLIDAEHILQDTIILCNDLEKQISGWFKIWAKIRKKLYKDKKDILSESKHFKLLGQVEEIKSELVNFIQKPTNKEDLIIFEKKLKKIRKILNFYNIIKQTAAEKSNLKYPKAAFKFIFLKCPMTIFDYSLYWLGYGGKHISKKISKGVDWALSMATTITCFIAIAGIINGIYLSDSFIIGFIKPFAWVWSLTWSFFQNKTPEAAAEMIKQGCLPYIIYHINTKVLVIFHWFSRWIPWGTSAVI